MGNCSYCGKETSLPFRCKFCSKYFCSKHRLPEDHKCAELESYKKRNKERWKNVVSSTINKKESPSINQEEGKIYYKKTGLIEKVKYWLNGREHHPYNYKWKLNYLIITILLFLVSLVALDVFYSNAQKLNEINLWIIKLGGVLILISLFFAIKFGWRLSKELINIIKRQRNWLKYLIIIIIIFFLWQVYANKDNVLNPVFEKYNETNFSLFSPIGLGNLSLSNSSSNNNTNNGGGFGNFINGIFDPKSQIDISQLEQEVHRLINVRRTNNGLSPLAFDSRLADIARAHSQDMAQNNFFEHVNLRGQDPTARANAASYSCYKSYGSYYTEGIAENIALTPIYSDVVGCGSTTNLESLANCIVDGWMTSPGHRQNILTSTYDKEGIGIAYSSDNKAYSTEDFC